MTPTSKSARMQCSPWVPPLLLSDLLPAVNLCFIPMLMFLRCCRSQDLATPAVHITTEVLACHATVLCCMPTVGIIGAGTNNARLAGLLRQLSAYYHKEPVLLFLVRVAQGLVHMGKGLLTLAPAHAHGQLLNGEL